VPTSPTNNNSPKEPTPPIGDMTEPPPMDDEVYSKHRYSAGVRPPVELEPEGKATPVPPKPPVTSNEEDSEESMEAETKPTPMRPPATKYGVQLRYGGGIRDFDR